MASKMKSLSLGRLILVSVIVAGATFFLTQALVVRGFAVSLSPTNLIVTLFSISILLLVLSIPIWRYRNLLKQGKARPKRVDPFYAVRILLLSKAVAISGSLFAGWHIGIVIYQLTAPVVISGAVARNFVGLVASIVMVIAGIYTESLCRLPEDDADDTEAAKA